MLSLEVWFNQHSYYVTNRTDMVEAWASGYHAVRTD